MNEENKCKKSTAPKNQGKKKEKEIDRKKLGSNFEVKENEESRKGSVVIIS